MTDTTLQILRDEIRLVSFAGEPCERCGATLDYMFKVKDGCLERCAERIVADQSAIIGDLVAALVDMRHHFGNPRREEWLNDVAFGEALRADARARDMIERVKKDAALTRT